MKKIIAVFGSLLVLASTKSKAQNPQQPVKKETVKPTNSPAPKADAVEIFLNLDGTKGEKTASVVKGANPIVVKGANPIVAKGVNPVVTKGANFTKGANPVYKGAPSAANQQVASHNHMPPPANNQVASHNHVAPKR